MASPVKKDQEFSKWVITTWDYLHTINANRRNASKNEQESKASKTWNKQYMSPPIKLQHPVEKTTLAKQRHLAYFSNWSDWIRSWRSISVFCFVFCFQTDTQMHSDYGDNLGKKCIEEVSAKLILFPFLGCIISIKLNIYEKVILCYARK